MEGKQMELNLDGNEQLAIDFDTNKKVDNTNCSKFKVHKVYANNVKKQLEKPERELQ